MTLSIKIQRLHCDTAMRIQRLTLARWKTPDNHGRQMLRIEIEALESVNDKIERILEGDV